MEKNMFKYAILLSILASASAQAWDGKLFKITNGSKIFGRLVREYDHSLFSGQREDNLTFYTKAMEKTLRLDGFKEEGLLFEKTENGILYWVPHEFNFFCEACDKNMGYTKGQTECYFRNSDENIKAFFAHPCPSDVAILCCCKQDSSYIKSQYARWADEWQKIAERCGFKFELIDYVDGKPVPATAHLDQPIQLAPIDRFTHFLHEEKMALGLMALSLLTLTVSSR